MVPEFGSRMSQQPTPHTLELMGRSVMMVPGMDALVFVLSIHWTGAFLWSGTDALVIVPVRT